MWKTTNAIILMFVVGMLMPLASAKYIEGVTPLVRICPTCSLYIWDYSHSMNLSSAATYFAYRVGEKADVQIGDVVWYALDVPKCTEITRAYADGSESTIRPCIQYAIHRVVGVNESKWTTRYIMKGDNNDDVDSQQPTFNQMIFKLLE